MAGVRRGTLGAGIVTRIGCADVTRDPEGRVVVKHSRQMDRPGLTFTRAEWEQLLFGPDSYRLAYGCLSWAACPVPQIVRGDADAHGLGLSAAAQR